MPRSTPPPLRLLACRPSPHSCRAALPRPLLRRTPPTARPAPRLFSTTARTASWTARTASNAAPAPPRRPRLSLRPLIYATVFLALGVASGQLSLKLVQGAYFPAPGSSAEAELACAQDEDIDRLPVVQQLRSAWTELPGGNAGAGAGAAEHAWGSDEYVMAKVKGLAKGRGGKTSGQEKQFVQETLGGPKGVGAMRRFFNHDANEAVVVVWLGYGVTGWPMVAHGGVIATVILDGLREARAACLSAVGESIDAADMPAADRDPASLSLSYLNPTFRNDFYVLHIGWGAGRPAPDDKTAYYAEFRTLGGTVLVRAEALFDEVTPA
ncbi:hypothetical protein K490DRAFT_60449 [Saccharata proteae CBS 121410]|uniref:Thioesterase domain-containing protein n=1 Tax=Saccharata proteae CBS 121410 TaxID=1314787 RepID=A0A9P4HQE5_9PEZI|nr:hypothetical protein K490DRAFT_60449 [Saccharata proteae CBS 121410]